MNSVNQVTILGNVGRDPEIRTWQSGGRVANFTIATSESWKDKTSGERKERTQWHNISVTNENLVGIVEKYVKKGSKVYLEGQLEHRKYQDKDGNDKYITEVVLRPYHGEIVLLDGKKAAPDAEQPADHKGFDEQCNGPGKADKIEDSIPF